MDSFINNSYPYQLWNKFSSNLINNTKLEKIALNINNKCRNDPLKMKKFADILKCIGKSNMSLKEVILSFNGNVEVIYPSHNDGILRNVLYSSIIKCIKSKSKFIEELMIKYENKTTKFHLFDSKFCCQLMEITYQQPYVMQPVHVQQPQYIMQPVHINSRTQQQPVPTSYAQQHRQKPY